jgi:CRP/FNR family transcriptional regulator, cyclic AMP receptor protein
MRKALLVLGILNDSDLDWMIAFGVRREIESGDVLIHEAQPIDSVFLVLDGVLSVTTRTMGNREAARLLSGEIVGEMSFVDARPPAATVRALEKSRVLAVPRSALQAKLDGEPPFAARFYKALAVLLSDRMRSTMGLLGYGAGAKLDDESSYSDELDMESLERASLAGARFDLFQRRLRAI